MTPTSLKTYTLKDLAQMAKKRGVHGWHAMRKDQLVRALVRVAKGSASDTKVSKKVSAPVRRATVAKLQSRNGKLTTVSSKSPRVVKRIEEAKARFDRNKNLSSSSNGQAKDRLVAMVRGPYWLHACWELTPSGVSRAQVALGQDWHTAKPILRLLAISSGGATSNSERIVRDVPIHGGVKNWYIDVLDPPQSYRLEIGYLGSTGKFFSLARSNVVTTPPAASTDEMVDPHWSDVAENCDKIYAMSGGFSPDNSSTELQELFEERMRRPMGSPMVTRYGVGAESLLPRLREFEFELDAELIVYGSTRPDSYVTLQGEPVKLRADGSFTVRLEMPNRRQVIPVVASSKDGVEQRTIVLAVERNTKVMEPVVRDSGE